MNRRPLLLAALLALASTAGLAAEPANPPASMDELAIASQGARLNGFIYRAAGAGAHPTVLFLHGYPGNERNLDLAQAVRRAGYNAIYIDYRGNWAAVARSSRATRWKTSRRRWHGRAIRRTPRSSASTRDSSRWSATVSVAGSR